VGYARLTCGQHSSQTPFAQVTPKREHLTRSEQQRWCLTCANAVRLRHLLSGWLRLFMTGDGWLCRMPPTVAALSQASQRRREIGRATRAGLQGTTGTEGCKLPAARTADLEARVHQTVLPIPYIHREEEVTILTHLRARRPVLLIGSSMVGKTKMAARVIAEKFASWPVAIPDNKTALADLDAKDAALQGSVIWLDDIDRLIGTGGIEQSSRPVDEDRLGGFLFGVLAWSFDEFAVDEGRAGADQGDEVGCVDGAPAVLR